MNPASGKVLRKQKLYPSLAKRIRQNVLQMTHDARSSHVGTSLSMADLLAVLYGGILRVRPEEPDWPARDRFILSKGHGCAGLYAALAERGFFPRAWLENFYQNGSRLAGHATHHGVPGVEVSTGSLGHGLPMACGMAVAGKRGGEDYRVFALLSDGECDEGSVWEAALFASHHKLDHLTVIVDYNKIQSLGAVKDILSLDPFIAKWEAFGWSAREIDGHDTDKIEKAFKEMPFKEGKPSCLIAHTLKGKGVGFMENALLWHYRSPDVEELRRALKELDGGEE